MADNFDLFGGTLPEISLPTRHTAYGMGNLVVYFVAFGFCIEHGN